MAALTLNPNGSFTYTPAASFKAPISFTYKANDGQLESNVATATITVTGPTALRSATNTLQHAKQHAAQLQAPGVLGNDTDADLDRMTAQIVQQVPANAGQRDAHGNCSFTYTPANGFSGATSSPTRPGRHAHSN